MKARFTHLGPLHWLFTSLTVVIVALSVNRLTDLTAGYLAPHEFLRWLDFNAMVPITLATVLVYFLLKRDIERRGQPAGSRLSLAIDIVFIAGVCLAGISSGLHELTNYVNTRFCGGGTDQSQICQIIAYNDDEFSHYLYYAGVILLNYALLDLEWLRPSNIKATTRDLLLIGANTLLIAAGIFANLAFEPAAIDFVGFGAVLLVADALLIARRGRLREHPFTFYIAVAYTTGIVGAALYKLLHQIS